LLKHAGTYWNSGRDLQKLAGTYQNLDRSLSDLAGTYRNSPELCGTLQNFATPCSNFSELSPFSDLHIPNLLYSK
jgi:hypothetical protein